MFIIPSIYNNILKEDSITGDKSASNIASAKQAVSDVKSRLQKRGIYDLPELKGINTLEQLSIEPFKFSFLLQVDDKQGELTLPKPILYNTLARVIKKENNFTLELKLEGSENVFKLVFNDEELITKLPGTKKDIMALIDETNGKGKFYSIIGNSSLRGEIKNSVENEGEEEGDDEFEEGDDINFKTDDGKEGRGKITKIDGDTYTISDKKGNEININKKNIKGKVENDVEEERREGNYYNGKDLKEVNDKLSEAKDKVKFFDIINQYKDDEDFQKVFLDSIIDSTKSIKINKKPLLTTLKELKGLGLLGEVDSMSTSKRKYLKFKLNFQNFMFDVMYLFSKMTKDGKQSKTLEVIRKFFKELFLISSKGKTSISDKQTRKMLWKKLLGSFLNFKSAFRKLQEMSKGGINKGGQSKELKSKSQGPKATMSNTVESFINSISKNIVLINEEDGEENEKEGGDINGKIYVKSITLGPKAKAKRGEDETSYARSKGETKKWDGKVNSLPEDGLTVNVDLELNDEGLDEEQKKVFKELSNIIKAEGSKNQLKVRRSKQNKNNTLIIIFYTKGAIVCEVPQGVNLRKVTEVTVGRKAGNEEIFDKSIKAKIQIS